MQSKQRKDIALSMRISEEDNKLLEQIATQTRQTKSAAVISAIHLYAERLRTPAGTSDPATKPPAPMTAGAERRPEAATERRAAVTISAPAEDIAAEDIAPKIGTRHPAQTVTAEDIAAALLKLSDNRAAYLRPHRIRRRRISARRRSDDKTRSEDLGRAGHPDNT